MTPQARPSARVRMAGSALLAVTLGGCGGDGPEAVREPASAPLYVPDLPPSDGLLERPDLQAVVELRIGREGEALVGLLSDGDPAVRARAALALASAGRDTEGSQFFLTHSSPPQLEGGYTAFGWLESGGEVLDELLLGDRVLRMTVEVPAEV